MRCGQVTPDGSRGLIVARGVCRGAVIHLRETQSAESHGAGHGPQGGSHARRFTHTAGYSGSSTAESRRPQPPFSGSRCARPTAAAYTIASRSSAEMEGHAAPLERRGRRGENGSERDTGAGPGVEPALRGIPGVLRPMLAMPCRTIWRPCPRSARRQKKATKGDGAQIGRPGSSTAQVAHWSASLTHRGHVTQARRHRSSKEKAQSKGKSSLAPFTGDAGQQRAQPAQRRSFHSYLAPIVRCTSDGFCVEAVAEPSTASATVAGQEERKAVAAAAPRIGRLRPIIPDLARKRDRDVTGGVARRGERRGSAVAGV